VPFVHSAYRTFQYACFISDNPYHRKLPSLLPIWEQGKIARVVVREYRLTLEANQRAEAVVSIGDAGRYRRKFHSCGPLDRRVFFGIDSDRPWPPLDKRYKGLMRARRQSVIPGSSSSRPPSPVPRPHPAVIPTSGRQRPRAISITN